MMARASTARRRWQQMRVSAWACIGAVCVLACSARAQPTGEPVSTLPAPPTAPAGLAAADVVEVTDAGSVVVRAADGTGVQRVRLVGVLVMRTVDPKRAAIEESARRLLADLLAGESVVVDEQRGSDGEVRRDRDGHPFAMIYRAPDGLCVNLETVRRGWARADTRTGFRHLELFREYERRARDAKRGLWGSGLPMPLPETSESEPETQGPGPAAPTPGPGTVIPISPAAPGAPKDPGTPSATGTGTVWVTRSGSKYHLKNCRHVAENATELALTDAHGRGLKPCKVCKPPE